MRRFIKSLGYQSIIITAVLLIIILVSFQSVEKVSNSEDRSAAIEKVIMKAAVQCYALEGSYPPSVDYLKDNYGIILDESQYFYFYDTNGANIAPTIQVIKR
jgi:competence protein ComGC